MSHTELPWHTVIDSDLVYIDSALLNVCDLYHRTAEYAIFTKENAEANAAFIVKACNNHENLIEAIQAALRISDLWLPQVVDAEHVGEAEALHLMRDKFLEAIKQAEEDQ